MRRGETPVLPIKIMKQRENRSGVSPDKYGASPDKSGRKNKRQHGCLDPKTVIPNEALKPNGAGRRGGILRFLLSVEMTVSKL